ncbi:MAG TPA: hypothetical protein PK954_15350, partial [Anaerolineales bacterium]|nr:hypothetical protein [Anaerolineales bacterium]
MSFISELQRWVDTVRALGLTPPALIGSDGDNQRGEDVRSGDDLIVIIRYDNHIVSRAPLSAGLVVVDQ